MKTFFVVWIWVACAPFVKSEIPNAVAAALRDPDRLIVYSIAPERTVSGIRGYAIHSDSPINKKKNVQLIASALLESIAADGQRAFCFVPHHAVRIFSDNRISDLIICYHCGSYQFFTGGIVIEGSISGDPTFLDMFLPQKKIQKAEQGAAANP